MCLMSINKIKFCDYFTNCRGTWLKDNIQSFEMEHCGRVCKLSDPPVFSVSMPSSHWKEVLWMRSVGEDPKRQLQWKEQVSHPSVRFTMEILEKTIRLLEQWHLCDSATVSSWLCFGLQITADVRGKVFPYGIRRQAGIKGRQTGADRKAKNNTCLSALKDLSQWGYSSL